MSLNQTALAMTVKLCPLTPCFCPSQVFVSFKWKQRNKNTESNKLNTTKKPKFFISLVFGRRDCNSFHVHKCIHLNIYTRKNQCQEPQCSPSRCWTCSQHLDCENSLNLHALDQVKRSSWMMMLASHISHHTHANYLWNYTYMWCMFVNSVLVHFICVKRHPIWSFINNCMNKIVLQHRPINWVVRLRNLILYIIKITRITPMTTNVFLIIYCVYIIKNICLLPLLIKSKQHKFVL